MHDATYYREQASRARRLARHLHQRDESALLSQMATDYDELAEDLEAGAVEIRHRNLMPQLRGKR
jgi:hypothetical protein